MTVFGVILFLAVWVMVILGGLGVGGLGKDSRDLGIRRHSGDREWRSLLD